jgi:hypothetical protein
MEATLNCASCSAPIPPSLFNQTELAPCSLCGSPLQAEVFPAFFRPPAQGRDGDPLVVDGEASCFYHPQKKARLPCEGCGRFLCALCDCELQGRHYCPGCLETGKQKGKIKNLENQRTLYDNIALALVIYPMVLLFGIYFAFITAPIALYTAIRHWNSPGSIVRPGKTRLVLAIILGVLELTGWVAFVYFISKEIRRHG